jgi:hypothetical protein
MVDRSDDHIESAHPQQSQGSQTNIYTGGGDYAQGNIDKREGVFANTVIFIGDSGSVPLQSLDPQLLTPEVLLGQWLEENWALATREIDNEQFWQQRISDARHVPAILENVRQARQRFPLDPSAAIDSFLVSINAHGFAQSKPILRILVAHH